MRDRCARLRDYVVGMRWVTAKLINTPDAIEQVRQWQDRQISDDNILSSLLARLVVPRRPAGP